MTTEQEAAPAPTADSTALVFNEVSKDRVARARRALKSKKSSFFKFKDGMNLIRVLPALPGEEDPWAMTDEHFFRNWAGGKSHFSFVCPQEAGIGPCPACEKREQLASTGNPVDFEESKNYRPRTQVYLRIIDRENEEAGVQIARVGSMIFERMLELWENEDVYGNDFTNPFSGDDLAIKRFEEDGYTKYRTDIRSGDHDRLAGTEEQMIQWLTQAGNRPLSNQIIVPSYEWVVNEGARLTEAAQGRGAQNSARPTAPAVVNSSGFGAGNNALVQGASGGAGQTATTPF